MKKILAVLLAMAMMLSLLTACGGSKTDEPADDATNDAAASDDAATDEPADEPAEETPADDAAEVDSFVMDEPEGEYTELTVWTFIELHQEFYINMAEKWNEANPDKQVRLTCINMQYDNMHNKLAIALESGNGAPDVVDIEIGKFPAFINGATIDLLDLNSYIDPYRDSIVESRMDIYAKDGAAYGYPTHMGTTVAFYNVELLEAAGIDYTTIKTWEDWKNAGVAYYEATGKPFSYVETTASWIINLMLVQKGGSYFDAEGNPNLTSQEMTDILNFLVECQETGAFTTIPGGQPDRDEAYASFNAGDFACQIMPFWQTSRFLNYMTDLNGKVEIATVPQWEVGGDVWTIGGGGTGTAVVSTGANAELAAEVFAFIKCSSEASTDIWNVLGFDPINCEVWSDTSLTQNPDNAYVQYFANAPFDPLVEMQDSIGALTDQTNAYWSDVTNEFCTVTLYSIFEGGVSVDEALASSQATVESYVS